MSLAEFDQRYRDWALRCVNPASWLPLAAGRELTQPRAHLLAQLYTVVLFSLYPGLVCGLEVGRSDGHKKEAIVDCTLPPIPPSIQSSAEMASSDRSALEKFPLLCDRKWPFRIRMEKKK